MGRLTQNEIERVEHELELESLSNEALKSDLLDHVLCDMESKIHQGMKFDHALNTITSNIPKTHFKKLDEETMRINPTTPLTIKILTNSAIGLLILASIFKLLKFPGTSEMLLIFFALSFLSILIGVTKNVFVKNTQTGRSQLIAFALLFSSLLAFFIFRTLQFPSANNLGIVTLVGFIIMFPGLSIYFYFSKKDNKQNMIIQMLANNEKTIEKWLLILVGFGLIFNSYSWVINHQSYVGVILFILIMLLVGPYIYTKTWIHYVYSKDSISSTSNLALLICSSIMIIGHMTLGLSSLLAPTAKYYVAYGGLALTALIAAIHYHTYSKSVSREYLTSFCMIMIAYLILRLFINLNWNIGIFNEMMNSITFNVGFIVIMTALLYYFRKEHLFKLTVMLILASHMIPSF